MPIEATCAHCGASYTRPPSLVGSYCSKACGYAARRKTVTETRRMVYAPSHPLAAKRGLVSQARVALYAKIGPGRHLCHWCRAEVRWMPGQGLARGALVADHLDHDWRNDAPENLVPSCQPCNGTRTTGHRVGADEIYVTRANGTRLRAVERQCEQCGNGFVVAHNQVAAGRGRFCSRSCARSAQPARVS